MNTGNFTLPGETGYESLVLELAQRWGADVIRDSDGTRLSGALLSAGYGVYSTICPVREHNAWIKDHMDTRQQTFLCSAPVIAESEETVIRPMDGFFAEQFAICDSAESLSLWQVYDRTAGTELPRENWTYDADTKSVRVQTHPWRQYTVSFLAWRVWEEISMYNHITNHWDKEHLMQLNPYHPEARAYLRDWLRDWCRNNPVTTVVRFTSLFYNFAWIWGDNERNRYLFTDWGSYDFTVSPAALRDFSQKYGYALCAEDFVRQGKYNATHRPPTRRLRDWMEFIGGFVREATRELTDIVHAAGKLAYVFYDDNWLGLEPYNGHFHEFGFDGVIKCVFSGYEARLCAGVPVKTHEIRFHPYLFPVGLGGAPTFAEGGHPGRDAMDYWLHVRRALLRQPVERAGLGGYLHLSQGYPDFLEAMDTIIAEFRAISALHTAGTPHCVKPRIGVLTAWGALRTWTLSGHFHETHKHTLIHLLESLSGLPFEVSFISLEEIQQGVPSNIDVILNAGAAGDAWSGGDLWRDPQLVDTLTAWVHQGGVFVGVGEPSAADGFRMAHVLDVDADDGRYACHGRWSYTVESIPGLLPEGFSPQTGSKVRLVSGKAKVLAKDGEHPNLTLHRFGKGQGIYLSGFEASSLSTRFLQNLLLYSTAGDMMIDGVTDDPRAECAVYPGAGKLALLNNSADTIAASSSWQGVRYSAELPPFALRVIELS